MEFREQSKKIIIDYLDKKYPEIRYEAGEISMLFPNGYTSAEVKVLSNDPFSFYVLPGRNGTKTTDNYVECKLGHQAKKEISALLIKNIPDFTDSDINQIEAQLADNSGFTKDINYNKKLKIPIYIRICKFGNKIHENDFKKNALKIRDILIENGYVINEYEYRYEWGKNKTFGEYVASLGVMSTTNELNVSLDDLVVYKHGLAEDKK